MKRTIFIFLLLTTSRLVYAQDDITVKGIVSDGQNLPMPGATVSEKGTKNSTITSIDGIYQIKVKSNAVLIFSFLGTKTTEQKVNNRTTINAKLLDETNSLNEVVVVGYGTKARKDLTGAVSSIKGDELEKSPVQNVAQALQGRIAGMQVTMPDGTPGSEPSIKIRGGTSITQSNEPLYVIDGVPQTGGLGFLDPMDIETIDVLKDASSTSIYGSQGGNGVVLITTKKIKGGQVSINYETYASVKKVTSEIPVMSPIDYVKLAYENSLGNAAREASFLKNYGTFEDIESNYANRPGQNWQKGIFGTPVFSQYHKLSINGGGTETKFNIFYSLNDDKGVMLESASRKNIAKIALNHNVNKKFSINAIANYSNQVTTGLGTQEGGNARLSMLQNLLRYRPTIGILGDDEDLADLVVDPNDDPNSPALQSPYISVSSQQRESTARSFFTNLQLRYYLTPKIVYQGLVAYTLDANTDKSFNDAQGIQAIRGGGPNGAQTQDLRNRFSYNNTITYSDTFNKKHKFDITAGQESIYNSSERLSVRSAGFPVVNLGWDRLDLGTIPSIPQTLTQDERIISFFARSNYSFNDKYLFSASIRADGSTKFGANHRWGYFPAVSAAWRINKEEFMKNATAFSDLKLRFSYGQAGNNRVDNYAALGIFTTGSYNLNNQVVPTAFQNSLPNPNLKWESTLSKNLGLDLGLFNQRISLTTELYDNRSVDLLYRTRIPANSGFTTQFQNIGSTSSRGLEFTLNTANIKNANFTWNTTFNIAFNKTKVLSLSEGEQSFLSPSYTTSSDYILQVGKPVGIMYGYVRDGLYQVSDFDFNPTTNTYVLKSGVANDSDAIEQPGYIKFKDINGDGVINASDRTAIGNSNPKFSGGLNNVFTYKGLDLSVFLNFTVGNDIYNANVLNNAALSQENLNTLAIFADRWTTIDAATGTRITDPTQLATLNAGKTNPSYIGNATGRLYSDIIEDGSFLRINNVSLGYSFPKQWLNKTKISRMRVYLTLYNLHVFTKYSGYDPEVNVSRSAITGGLDFSAYPRTKSFVTGLNISL